MNAQLHVVISITEREAGLLLDLCENIGGPCSARGRKFTDRLGSELRDLGILSIRAFLINGDALDAPQAITTEDDK